VADGVIPSNEGRGYVLRRIIRRALRHGHKLGQNQPFFHTLVSPLVVEMGEAYPALKSAQAAIEKIILNEEEQFAKTLDAGMKILNQDLEQLKDQTIPGDVVFKLYDTYGFPVDLTADVAREKNLKIDLEGFEQAMNQQRERARAVKHFAADYNNAIALEGRTAFCGYEGTQGRGVVKQLLVTGESQQQASAGQTLAVVLNETPFYGESGGQVGDQGQLTWAGGRMDVVDTQKQGDVVLHLGQLLEGSLQVGDTVLAVVDASKRHATALNHSATHLLHAALRKVLGSHVAQKGSQVNADRLRFDFVHFEAMTPEQLQAVTDLVNDEIRANTPVTTDIMSIDAAKNSGAMALFGEKYGDEVRVLSMGQDKFSVELCGGTHARRTGDIGFCKIIAETGIAAGVRRIEAVTGTGALAWVQQTSQTLNHLSDLLKTSPDSLVEKTKQTLEKNRVLEKELDRLKAKLASNSGGDLSQQAQEVNGVKVLVTRLDDVDSKMLRQTMDQMKNKLGSAVIVLAAVCDGKAVLISGVTNDLTERFHAGQLMSHVASHMGGKGGGRADMAQGGANDLAKLDAALKSVIEWVAAR